MSETLPDTAPQPQPHTTPEAQAQPAQQDQHVPSIEELSYQQCDNCSTGVLQVIRYDPGALHEAGQDLSAEHQHPSGGAYETVCGFCGQRLSHTLGNGQTQGGGA